MRAVAVTELGGTPSLVELPRPEPGPDEVLVRLAAAGVNPMDQALVDGQFDGRLPHTFPLVLGFDGAGEVEAAGGEVSRFAVGDQVYGQFFHPPLGRSGSYAEYAAVPQRMDNGAIGHAPRGLPLWRAAAAPTAAMTAIGLLDEVGLRAGQTVLIVGASGGVGCFATQLAAAMGALVVATARASAAEQVRALGAAETVDYAAAPLVEQVRAAHPGGVDVLLDLVSHGGSGAFEANASLVREGGTAASIVSPPANGRRAPPSASAPSTTCSATRPRCSTGSPPRSTPGGCASRSRRRCRCATPRRCWLAGAPVAPAARPWSAPERRRTDAPANGLRRYGRSRRPVTTADTAR